MLQTLLNTPKITKSIQWGVHQFNKNANMTITINTVNPSKCFVLLNGSCGGGDSGGDWRYAFSISPYYTNLTATSITIASSITSVDASYPGQITWQIIEYV